MAKSRKQKNFNLGVFRALFAENWQNQILSKNLVLLVLSILRPPNQRPNQDSCTHVRWRDLQNSQRLEAVTAQKMKFPIKCFFSKCDQTRSIQRILSLLLNKYLMENFIFFAVLFLLLQHSHPIKLQNSFFSDNSRSS